MGRWLRNIAQEVHVDNVEESTFREAMSLFATGVTIISSRTEDGPVGMTASAVASLSLHPVLLLVCISTLLPTHEVLESTGRFAVNVLGESDSALARRFATPGIDKFSGIGHSDREGVPVLHNSIAYFVCDVHERHPGGDHSIFIGAVRQLGLRRGARPLLYFGAQFGHLAESDDALLRSWLEGPAAL